MRAELADGRVLEFPDGTDPLVIQATVKKMLGGQPTEQPQAQPQEQSSLLKRTGSLALESAKNVPQSAWNLVEGITMAAMSPLDTLQALSEAAFGGVEKLIPGEQSHEAKFNQFVDIYKERYGGLDELHNTIATDPMGVFADMSMLLSGGGAATAKVGQLAGSERVAQAGSQISKAGAVADPINVAITGFGKVAGGKAAESIYTSATKMPTTKGMPKRKAAVNKALDEGLMPSEHGINLLNELETGLGEKIGAVIDDATKQGDMFNRDLLFKNLRSAVRKVEFGPKSATIKKQIFNEMNQIRAQHPKKITPREMQNIKTAFQKAVSENDWGKTSTGLKLAQKEISRAAREVLQERYPELKGLNKELAEFRNLEKELERAASRIGNRDPLGMTKMLLASGGGATAGIEGMAAGLGLGLVLDPRVQSKIAILLRKLKKKGVKRDPKLYTAREVLRQGGIADTEPDQQLAP